MNVLWPRWFRLVGLSLLTLFASFWLLGCPPASCPQCKKCDSCTTPVPQTCKSDGSVPTREVPPEPRQPVSDAGTPEKCPQCPDKSCPTKECPDKDCPDKQCPKCPDCPDTKPPTPKVVTRCGTPTTDFYNLPGQAPAGMSKGAVVRCETLLKRTKYSHSFDPQFKVVGSSVLYGYKIVRMVYLTEPKPGVKRWTSALLYVPTADNGACRKAAPLALVAHGTTGIAPTCGPSRFPVYGLQYMTLPLVGRGFLAIAPDYLGLGVPSRTTHPYLVSEPTTAAMMDAVRAVKALSRSGDLAGCAGDKLVMVGHSQGGHAVLKASTKTRQELPSIRHVGTVSFAPALGSAGVWVEGLKSNYRTTQGTVYLLSLYWAAEQYYGYKNKNWLRADFRKSWEAMVKSMCFAEIDALIRGAYPTLGDIFTSTFLNATITCERTRNCSAYEPFYSMVKNNVSGLRKPNAPTLLMQGSRDSVLSAASVRCIADRLKRHGGRSDACLMSGSTHASVVPNGWSRAMKWLEALVAGRSPTPPSCASSWPACK